MIEQKGYIFNWKLPEPNTISFHTFYYQENVWVVLSYKEFTGIGEAAPFKPITGDSQEEVINEFKTLSTIPLDPTTDSVEKLHSFLDGKISSHTLRAAIDFAYHDLIARIKKIPVYQLYAKKPKTVENSFTILIHENIEETKKDVEQIYKTYPHLKILKIKLKGENDIERVKVIKAVSPKNMKYIVDANQGFTDAKVAVKTLNEISKILGKVILVEEPCPKGELEKLKYVKDHVKGMLVFADESAATVEDAEKVVKANAAHGINIKLQKAGGIWPAKQIAEMCKKASMQCMVGCMLEGPLGITAGIHFAVSTPVILSDLDADLDNPMYVDGQPLFANGKRIPNANPGLGILLIEKKIKELVKKKKVIYKEIK